MDLELVVQKWGNCAKIELTTFQQNLQIWQIRCDRCECERCHFPSNCVCCGCAGLCIKSMMVKHSVAIFPCEPVEGFYWLNTPSSSESLSDKFQIELYNHIIFLQNTGVGEIGPYQHCEAILWTKIQVLKSWLDKTDSSSEELSPNVSNCAWWRCRGRVHKKI